MHKGYRDAGFYKEPDGILGVIQTPLWFVKGPVENVGPCRYRGT